MGLFDKSKLTDIAKGVQNAGNGLASTLSSGLSGLGKKKNDKKEPAEEAATSDIPEVVEAVPVAASAPATQPVVIDSLDGMQTWLQSFEATAKPAALQTLQQQIQVLSFVQSPSMTGMAVDTMLASLNRALKYAESEVEKDEIRESFTSMIQNFMFFSEARLQYAIESNKQETAKLLSTAGEMLSHSVKGVASLAAGGRAATAGVVIKNVFSTPAVQKKFFSAVAAWIGNKTGLEKKEREYNEMLANLFDTLDMYASLIGPSIVVHGMLKRYIPWVMKDYRRKKFKLISDRMAELKRGEVFELISNSSATVSAGIKGLMSGNLNTLTDVVTDLSKSLGTSKAFTKSEGGDFETLHSLVTAGEAQIDRLEQGVALADTQLMALNAELSDVSFLNVFKKKDLCDKMEKLEKEKEELEAKLKKAKDWQMGIQSLQEEAAPIQEEIVAYEARLQAIAAKYSIMP